MLPMTVDNNPCIVVIGVAIHCIALSHEARALVRPRTPSPAENMIYTEGLANGHPSGAAAPAPSAPPSSLASLSSAPSCRDFQPRRRCARQRSASWAASRNSVSSTPKCRSAPAMVRRRPIPGIQACEQNTYFVLGFQKKIRPGSRKQYASGGAKTWKVYSPSKKLGSHEGKHTPKTRHFALDSRRKYASHGKIRPNPISGFQNK